MRDLDRIKEVREFRVTGPQLTSLLISTLVLTSALFAIGFQLGRLRSPVDLALLEPLGESDQDAGSLLAEMLAEKKQRTLASTAPVPLATSDEARAADGAPALSASDVEAADEEAARLERVESDRIEEERLEEERLEEERLEEERLAALRVEEVRAAEAEAIARRSVKEVVVRSFPSEETPAPAPEPLPEPVPELASVTEPAPASVRLPAAPAGRGFTVQVGAFESVDDAADIIAGLEARGLDVFHVAATVNGKVYHRVRVGLYGTQAEAKDAAAKLEGATKHGTYVTEQP